MDSNADDRAAQGPGRFAGIGRWGLPALVALLSLAGSGSALGDHNNSSPRASFTVSPAAPVTGETVTFTSTSTDSDGRVVSQAWDIDGDGFDDGTGTTITRTPASATTYRVRLRVWDDDGASNTTTTRTVSVAANRAPIAAFSAPSDPQKNEAVTLTSSSSDPDGRPLVSQSWDLDNDGAYDDGDGASAQKTFGAVGTHRVRLRVTDSGGATSTTFRDIVIRKRPPVASFTKTASSADSFEAISFSSTSTDSDGQITSYQWDFGDGATASGGSTAHEYEDDGTYSVRLTVTDDDGEVRSATQSVTIRNRAPQAAFTPSSSETDTLDPIVFTSSSSDRDGDIVSHEWEFGDGTSSTEESPSHEYSDDGEYEVTLTVTDDDGATRSTSREVTIRNRSPVATFSYAPREPMTGDEVVLTSSSSDRDGSVDQHEWDLDGDGEYDDATGPEARTSFGEEGSHAVALRVRDDDGDESAPAFDSIDVQRRPPADVVTGDLGPGDLGGRIVDAPRLLDPFPRVRIRGVTTATGARIDLLSVTTGGGNRVLVRCKGRDCPWARRVQTARFAASRTRALRIPGFSRRHLRAGTVLEVFVTRRGMVGKYTRIRIRAVKAPKRSDRCTAVGSAAPRRCPA